MRIRVRVREVDANSTPGAKEAREMYSLTPMKVYMLDRVQDDPACLARMERVLKAIGVPTELSLIHI